MLGYGAKVLSAALSKGRQISAGQIANWQGASCQANTGMVGDLTWSGKTALSDKMCIPVIEDGDLRALRLEVPALAAPRQAASAPAAVQQTAAERQLEVARKVAEFFKSCSAVEYIDGQRIEAFTDRSNYDDQAKQYRLQHDVQRQRITDLKADKQNGAVARDNLSKEVDAAQSRGDELRAVCTAISDTLEASTKTFQTQLDKLMPQLAALVEVRLSLLALPALPAVRHAARN